MAIIRKVNLICVKMKRIELKGKSNPKGNHFDTFWNRWRTRKSRKES